MDPRVEQAEAQIAAGQAANALATLSELIASFEESRDVTETTWAAFYEAANAYHLLGNTRMAMQAMETSLEICRKLPNESRNLSGTLRSMSILYAHVGRLEQAIALTRERLSIVDPDRDPSAFFNARTRLGRYLRNIGEHQEAVVRLEPVWSELISRPQPDAKTIDEIGVDFCASLCSLNRFDEFEGVVRQWAGAVAGNAPFRDGGLGYEDQTYRCKLYLYLGLEKPCFQVFPLEPLPHPALTQLLTESKADNAHDLSEPLELAQWQFAICDHGDDTILQGSMMFFGPMGGGDEGCGMVISAEGHEGVMGHWDGKRWNAIYRLPMPRIITLPVAPD